MGRLSRELSDPWGILVAGVAGGVAVAASMPVAVGIGVGAAVYGVKVAVGALTRDPPEPVVAEPKVLRPRYGTAAATWLKRAEDASRKLHDLARDEHGGATATAFQHSSAEAADIVEDMRRVAGQSAAVARALDTAWSSGLQAEADDAAALARQTPSDIPAQQSAKALQDRLDVCARLRQASDALDSRLQASALGLEGLVARVAELSATAGAVGDLDPSPADLASLTTELDGMRVGLADVEAAARKALGSAA